eukprot:291124-Chlamydomonas_euryale.AAC.2
MLRPPADPGAEPEPWLGMCGEDFEQMQTHDGVQLLVWEGSFQPCTKKRHDTTLILASASVACPVRKNGEIKKQARASTSHPALLVVDTCPERSTLC